MSSWDNGGGVSAECPWRAFSSAAARQACLIRINLEGVLDCVGRTFEVLPGAEISMEANPDSLHTAEKASGFLAAGVNRISLGVQSLHDGMLETLGRLHRANAAREAFRAIREAGCANLSLDLMWGLPGQTLEQWLEDARAAIALGPEHISAYGLTLEPGTPLAESCGDAELPSEDVQCAMYLEGIRLFEEAGLHHYEVSNFARDGFRCRHNLGYWEGRDYLGSALRRHPRSAGSAGPIRRGKAGWSRCGKGAAALSGNRWIGQRGRWSS